MTNHSSESDLAARVRAALTHLDDIAGRRALLESWIELDPSLEPLDIAAALVGLLEEAEARPAPEPERRPQHGDGPPHRTKEGALPRKPDDGNELYRIGVGYRDEVKPSQIVAIISREGMLDGRLIGNIDIHDEHTYVELPEGMPAETFEKLQTVDIQGRPMAIERYEGETSEERRRPRRDDRGFQRGGQRRGGGRGFQGGGGRGGRRDFHGGGRSYRGDGDSRGGGRSYRGDGDSRGGDRSYRGGGGRSYRGGGDSRGGGRPYRGDGDSRGGDRSYRNGGDSRGGGRRYQGGGGKSFHGGGGYRGQDRSR